MVDESKSDDGDGDVVMQRPCLIIGRVPDNIWKKLVQFLVWSDAASLYAGSSPVRDLMRGKWSPHWMVTAERSAMAVAAANSSWKQLSWDGKNPVGVAKFFVAPGTNNDAALLQQIQLSRKDLRGV